MNAVEIEQAITDLAEQPFDHAQFPYAFLEAFDNIAKQWTIVVSRTSSENRPFLPNGLIDDRSTVTSEAFALYDAPLWYMALIASRLHLVWVATVCGKLETRYR